MSRTKYDRRLRDMICPQCQKPFVLAWNDYTKVGDNWIPQTLKERSCPSGGTYDMSIECPHCDYVEPL